MKITIEITKLPTFLDGSDGSMWRGRCTPAEQWAMIFADKDMASRRFVCVADLLALSEKPEEEKYQPDNPQFPVPKISEQSAFDAVDGKFGDPTN